MRARTMVLVLVLLLLVGAVGAVLVSSGGEVEAATGPLERLAVAGDKSWYEVWPWLLESVLEGKVVHCNCADVLGLSRAFTVLICVDQCWEG